MSLFRKGSKARTRIRNILIVEDEPLVAFDNELSLEQAGYNVVGTVNTAEEAIAILQKGGVDLVLADVNLRDGGSGVDVARVAQAAGIPAVYATGNCPGDAQRYALGCLIKPYSSSQLAQAIKAVDGVLAGKQADVAPAPLHLYEWPTRLAGT